MEERYVEPYLVKARCPFCDEENVIELDVDDKDVCEHFVEFDGEEFLFSSEGE